MSVTIDEDVASAPRPGLARGFADGPPGGSPGDRSELLRRLLFTLGALIVYRIGTLLPIPGIDLRAVSAFFAERSSGIIGLLDMFGGSAIGHVSIFALGIMPYISAFIIVQLASHIIPQLGRLTAGGTAERTRLNQYARILAAVLAAFQAVGVAVALKGVPGLVGTPSLIFEATTVVTMVAGAVFLMWLAEQITANGTGDGALLILACSIVSRLPFNLNNALNAVRTGDMEFIWVLGALLMVAAFLAAVAFMECAERRNPLYDPGYEIGQGCPPGSYRNVPLRINPAGVVPALAAGIFVAPLLQSIVTIGGPETVAARYFSGGRGFDLLYGALLVMFAAYFNFAILDPGATAKKPAESGGFLPSDGSRERTARRMQWLHFAVAALYVAAVCMLPLLIYRWTHLPFLLSGFQIFLLAWVMVRVLERVRASWQS
jgi:preprotein translocase subunit SecY